jgi:hypothetical protein
VNAITDSMPNEFRPSNIIPFDSQELSSSSFDEFDNDDDAINMLFFLNDNVILKDCRGIKREVTYLGPQNSGGILQHKVWTRNGHDFLVDGATILVSIELYATEIPKLTQEQIQSISHPQMTNKNLWDFIVK